MRSGQAVLWTEQALKFADCSATNKNAQLSNKSETYESKINIQAARSANMRWGCTLSAFLLLSYLVCIAFGLLVARHFYMHEAWAPILPDFEWITWQGFIFGAIGSFLYGWYIAIIVVPLYQFFGGRSEV